MNKVPIICHYKRQNTVETSTYVAKFVTMKQAVELVYALKYKLRIFSIEIMEDETNFFGDKNTVILNSSTPESTLKKKHHLINYKYVR